MVRFHDTTSQKTVIVKTMVSEIESMPDLINSQFLVEVVLIHGKTSISCEVRGLTGRRTFWNRYVRPSVRPPTRLCPLNIF